MYMVFIPDVHASAGYVTSTGGGGVVGSRVAFDPFGSIWPALAEGFLTLPPTSFRRAVGGCAGLSWAVLKSDPRH